MTHLFQVSQGFIYLLKFLFVSFDFVRKTVSNGAVMTKICTMVLKLEYSTHLSLAELIFFLFFILHIHALVLYFYSTLHPLYIQFYIKMCSFVPLWIHFHPVATCLHRAFICTPPFCLSGVEKAFSRQHLPCPYYYYLIELD